MDGDKEPSRTMPLFISTHLPTHPHTSTPHPIPLRSNKRAGGVVPSNALDASQAF